MKKICFVFLVFIPIACFAEKMSDLQMQALDSDIEILTQQRDEKYEALRNCEKATQGFKIAGLTTLVATGVGVYGNIKLSQKLKGKNLVNSFNGVKVVDNVSQEEKNKDACEDLGIC